jgi:hypothetical protein
MNQVASVLRRAALRIFAIDLLRGLVVASCAALAGATMLLIVSRLTALAVPWPAVALYTGVGVAVIALVWAAVARKDRIAVARRVDEGADLRETLSTALCVAGRDDPWARVTVEAAAQAARSVNVRRAVPVTPPRFWPVPIALALVLLIAWLTVPNRDLFGVRAAAAERERTTNAVLEVRQKVEEELRKVEELASKVDAGAGEQEKTEADRPEGRAPEEIKRDAIRKLTTLRDRLEQLRQGEKGQSLDAVRQQLKRLKTPGEGPLSDLSRELARGDFQRASEELRKALEKLQAGALSDEQKARMAEQLRNLQSQLEKLAQDRQDLVRALERAGLDKRLAADPEALKAELEKNNDLTDEQKKALQQASQAQSRSSALSASMAAAMGQMARGMSEEGLEQEGLDGAESLEGALSELEQLAAEMAQCDAARSACEGSLAALSEFTDSQCQGMGECEGGLVPGTRPFSAGWKESMGAGRGGPGRSRGGGDPGENAAEFKKDKQKFNTKNQGGPIISSRLVQGEQVRGESRAQFAEAAAAAEASAAEAIENNVYPREYQDAIKHYFGRLKAKAKVEEVDSPASPAAGAGSKP